MAQAIYTTIVHLAIWVLFLLPPRIDPTDGGISSLERRMKTRQNSTTKLVCLDLAYLETEPTLLCCLCDVKEP
jgi:hypothetical protein